MSTKDSVLAQYEKNKQAASGNKISQEERLKKYFTTLLMGNQRMGEKRIRILPTKDGSSPFIEVYFHEVQIDGKWYKIFDPKQDGLRSPLNEVYDSLMATGVESDKILARNYRARKFYIVKVIDRENEQDGVKFWRFKHNGKGEGILDKIFPIFKNKGDITDVTNGRDLIISLAITKSNTGKEYTTINSIIPEDSGPLLTNPEDYKEWVNDEIQWTDVYSKRSEDYLDMVAKGEIPRWDNDSKKWVSNSTESASIGGTTSTTTAPDLQDGEDADDDLPF